MGEELKQGAAYPSIRMAGTWSYAREPLVAQPSRGDQHIGSGLTLAVLPPDGEHGGDEIDEDVAIDLDGATINVGVAWSF